MALAFLVSGSVLAAFFGLVEQAQRGANNQREESRPAYEEEYNPWQDPWSQWTMAVFSVVATGASLVGIWLLRRTFEETRRTARAAIKANSIAQTSAQRQLRAYIFPEEAFIAGVAASPQSVVYIRFKNTGQTPSYYGTLWTNFGAFSEFDKFEQGTKIARTVPNSGPGQSFTRERALHTVDLFDVFRDARDLEHGGVYLFGSLRYQDAFQQWRHTTFRLKLRDIPRDDIKDDRLDFLFCDAGNDSD
jgi:hypothetical protein